MKKSNTLFTLAFFAILAFSSCEREQWGNAQKGPDDIDNRLTKYNRQSSKSPITSPNRILKLLKIR